MAKYRVNATVVGNKYIGDFEAESKEAANEAASKVAGVYLCHQCEKECADAEISELTAELVEEE
jgi:hypothetical protein